MPTDPYSGAEAQGRYEKCTWVKVGSVPGTLYHLDYLKIGI